MTSYPSVSLSGAVLLAAAMGIPGSARAQVQDRPYSADEFRWVDSTWREDVAFAAVNGLVSVVAVGLARLVRGEPVLDGLGWAALGGVGCYSAKRLAATQVTGAGFLGRELNALGASVVQNAMAGRGPAARLWFPVGPGFMVLNASGPHRVQWGLDAHAVAWMGASLLDDSKAFDLRASLEAGTAVFRSTTLDYNGRVRGGLIFLSDWADEPMADVVAHESAHVLQGDFLQIVGGTATEVWIRGRDRMFGGSFVWVTGLARPTGFLLLGDGVLSPSLSPLEVEATYLEVRP